MSLFDEMDRDDLGLRLYAEPEFTYLNRSGRPGAQRIREALDAWSARYPGEHKEELRARFRSRDNTQYRSAFFELFLHELLVRLDCRVVVHPPMAGRARRHIS